MTAPGRPRPPRASLAALLLALAGCAARSAGLPGPAPPGQGYPSSPAYGQPAATAFPSPPPPPAGTSPGGRFAQPPADAPAQPDGSTAREPATLSAALFSLESSARLLELSLSSCDVACRALGSMERAAQRVCDLSRQTDEAPRCDDARSRLRSARARVRAACGSCPEGPSTEPDAP